jgi:hypothetical protein
MRIIGLVHPNSSTYSIIDSQYFYGLSDMLCVDITRNFPEHDHYRVNSWNIRHTRQRRGRCPLMTLLRATSFLLVHAE